MQPGILTTLTTGIADFPALPTVVTRVMEISGDPESSAHDLMEVISPDPVIAVKVLKMANSVFYGRARKTATLEQAVVVLGFNEIRNIVLAAAVFNTFSKLGNIDQFDIGEFWKHSFLCGLAAKIISKELKLPGNEMFILGLIHDIGKLAVCMVLPVQFSEVVKMTGPFELQTFQAEQEILGTTHDEVGGRLFNHWLFPEEMVAAVSFHHRLEMADTQTLIPLAIHLADGLAHIQQSPGTGQTNSSRKPVEDVSSEIVTTAQSYGIKWSLQDVHRYQSELAAQSEAQSDLMGILLQ